MSDECNINIPFFINYSLPCFGPPGPTGATGSIENIESLGGEPVVAGIINDGVMVVEYQDGSTGQIGCQPYLPIYNSSGIQATTGIITGTVMLLSFTDGSTGQVGTSCTTGPTGVTGANGGFITNMSGSLVASGCLLYTSDAADD